MAEQTRGPRPRVDVGAESAGPRNNATVATNSTADCDDGVRDRLNNCDIPGSSSPEICAEESEEEDSASSECAICLQTWSHPVQLPCKHIFCFLCVKGIANQSKKCALCRSEIPADYLHHPALVEKNQLLKQPVYDGEYQWFYEGNRGWWQYDERASTDIEEHFKTKDKRFEILIAGFLYVIDLEHMCQYRRNDPTRRRHIKRDLVNIPDKKGIAGLNYQRLSSPLRQRRDGDGGEADNVAAPPPTSQSNTAPQPTTTTQTRSQTRSQTRPTNRSQQPDSNRPQASTDSVVTTRPADSSDSVTANSTTSVPSQSRVDVDASNVCVQNGAGDGNRKVTNARVPSSVAQRTSQPGVNVADRTVARPAPDVVSSRPEVNTRSRPSGRPVSDEGRSVPGRAVALVSGLSARLSQLSLDQDDEAPPLPARRRRGPSGGRDGNTD